MNVIWPLKRDSKTDVSGEPFPFPRATIGPVDNAELIIVKQPNEPLIFDVVKLINNSSSQNKGNHYRGGGLKM